MTEPKTLHRLCALGEGEAGKVRFVLADDLGEMFVGQVAPAVSEKVVRGGGRSGQMLTQR